MSKSYYDSLIVELKNKGFRLTKVRKAIIEELDLSRKPLSAGELIELLDKHGLKPHKTSVYREINFMLEQEIINRVTFGERQDRFELAALEHHHHAICQNCGEIEDIDCGEGIRQIEEMLNKQKFKVSNHLIEFFGLCKNCQQSN